MVEREVGTDDDPTWRHVWRSSRESRLFAAGIDALVDDSLATEVTDELGTVYQLVDRDC